MGGSILPVGMVWNYIGETGTELYRCLHSIPYGAHFGIKKGNIGPKNTCFGERKALIFNKLAWPAPNSNQTNGRLLLEIVPLP